MTQVKMSNTLRALPLIALLLVLLAAPPHQGDSAPAAQLGNNQQVLVWVAPYATPTDAYNSSASQIGEIAFLSGNGQLESLFPIEGRVNRITPCGGGAQSPDGRYFAFFVGSDRDAGGTIYIMRDGRRPLSVVTDVQFLSCRGANGRFTFSPNSARFAYINYPVTARTNASGYAAGELVVMNTGSSYSQARSFSGQIAAFDLNNDRLVYVSFITDAQNAAREATLNLWNGSNDQELISLPSGSNCRYISAYVKIAPNNSAYWLSLVTSCGTQNPSREWQLFRLDANANGTLRNGLAVRTQDMGRLSFESTAEVNNLFFSPNGQDVLYTLPDGTRSFAARLQNITLNDLLQEQTLIAANAIMPHYNPSEDSPVRFSNDGRWLAVTVNSLSPNETVLQVFDLRDLSAPPIMIDAPGNDNRVPFMAFTQDSSRLIYLIGGRNGRNNALYRLNLNSGETELIGRGTFADWAQLSPNGEQLLITSWVEPNRPSAARALDLLLININSGERQTLVAGEMGSAADNAYQFVLPLAWPSVR